MTDGEFLLTFQREFERLGRDEFDSEPEERRRVLLWRALQLAGLGFDNPTSVALSDAGIDLGRARTLVSAGCPLELVARILL